MARIEGEIIIGRPVDVVFDYVADQSNEPQIGVDKNTTVVFPAPLMSTIEELVAFLTREDNAARGGTVRAIGRPDGTMASAASR